MMSRGGEETATGLAAGATNAKPFVPSFSPADTMKTASATAKPFTPSGMATKAPSFKPAEPFVPTMAQSPPVAHLPPQFELSEQTVFHSEEPPTFCPPGMTPSSSFFLSGTIRKELTQRLAVTFQRSTSSHIPDHVNGYHTVELIEPPKEHDSPVLGKRTLRYRGLSNERGEAHCLHRIDDVSTVPPSLAGVEALSHPSIVQVHFASVTKEFLGRSTSLLVVSDLFPGAANAFTLYYQRPCPDALLRVYALQLLSGMRYLYSQSKGHASVLVDPTKMLITGPGRIRLNGIGLTSFTSADQTRTADMINLGRTLWALAVGIVGQQAAASPTMTRLIAILQRGESDPRLIDDVLLADSGRRVMDASLGYIDTLEGQLAQSYLNGDLLHLSTKLAFVASDISLENSSDARIVRLFYRSIFGPIGGLSESHAIRSLALLGTGSPEFITLRAGPETRDDTVLVVRYRDVRVALEACHELLMDQARRAQSIPV